MIAQGSATLSANALDFLADSATYAISLWAIGRSLTVRTGAAISLLGLFGVLANLAAAALLVRYRGGDANVRSSGSARATTAVSHHRKAAHSHLPRRSTASIHRAARLFLPHAEVPVGTTLHWNHKPTELGRSPQSRPFFGRNHVSFSGKCARMPA